MLVRGATGSIRFHPVSRVCGARRRRIARRRFGAIPGNASSSVARRVGFRRFRERPRAFPHLAGAAVRLFRDHAASSRRMARHPLEAERSRHHGLADRRRRSGAEPLRRRAPHSPGGWASRLAGPIRLAKEFGSPRHFGPGDAGGSLGPRRRHGRRHPGAAIAQRSLSGAATSSAWSNSPGIKSGSTTVSKPRPAASRSATSFSPTLAISSI